MYDGSDITDPVLLSLNHDSKQLSVRSTANELFVQMIGNVREPLNAVYTSVVADGTPFLSGCGGYIHGQGAINAPSNLNGQLICVWYVESESEQHTILLDNLDAGNENGKTSTYSMAVR